MAKSREFWQEQTADETYDKDYVGDLENRNIYPENEDDIDQLDEERYDDISDDEIEEYIRSNDVSDMNREFESSEIQREAQSDIPETDDVSGIDEGIDDDPDVMEAGGYDDTDYDDYDDYDPVG